MREGVFKKIETFISIPESFVYLGVIHPGRLLLQRLRPSRLVDLGEAVVAVVGPFQLQVLQHARIEHSLKGGKVNNVYV